MTTGPAPPSLESRHRQPELMDDPALDVGRHRAALRALRRVNRVSGAAGRVWRQARMLHAHLRRPVRVLDVACGGGDVLLDVAGRARRARVPIALHGCDVSRVALDELMRGAADAGFRHVEGFELDAIEGDLPTGYDLITSSLFLHHLDRADAVALLARMAAATAHSLLVQDLLRTRLGYGLAWIGLHTLTRSDVARVDGLRSVRAAFVLGDVRAMCADAGLSDARLERVWPERFVLHWRRP